MPVRNPVLFLLLLASSCWSLALRAEEPDVSADQMPRIPPKSIEEALKSFAIKDGFKIELAAGEPLTTDPIAISFDAQGRMFTCEMRGYSERRDDAIGRVRMLTDDDGDGVYDRATTYAEGLKWPTSLICWDSGIFVGATPDIWWFKDTDGDGVADEKKVVFTGFGADADRLNVQGLTNSLVWGPDWRIYGATARHGGAITRPDVPGDPGVNLRGYDFSFDPKKLDLRQETGAVQYGMTFDDDGMRYVCSNSSHCLAIIYSWPWVGLNLPDPKVTIPVDGAAAEVYRTSGVEPWRVVRTRWRVQGAVSGPIEGGGRDSGYFTSASGLGIYRGDALPAEFGGNLFVGDVGSNLVHRKLIEKSEDRVSVLARRPDDEQKVEFLTSTDNWFRPVMCQNGPDGALYIVDMYRETIEHPWSLPPNIKKHLDLNSGNDRGRIWRVSPVDWKRPEKVSVDGDVVSKLGDSQGWVRDMAAQLLHAKGEVGGLAEAATGAKSEHARLSALYGLASNGKLDQQLLETALGDSSSIVRRHAVRLATGIAVGAAAIAKLAADEDPWVRFEAALLLTKTEKYPASTVPVSTLAEIAKVSAGDDWILSAVVEAASKRGEIGKLFAAVWDPAANSPLYAKLGARAAAGDVASFERVAATENFAVAAAILKAMPKRPGIDALRPLIDRAKGQASADAVWLTSLDPDVPAENFWKLVVEDPSVSLVALDALQRDKNWKAEALTRWQKLPASARTQVLAKLTPAELLGAVEAKQLDAREISIPTRATLRSSKDAEIQKRAVAAFGEPIEQNRAEVAEQFRPALDLKGDPAAGLQIFTERCNVCHEKPGSTDANAGPDLASFKNKGDAAILESLISPNKEVAPQFFAWQIETKDGGNFIGLLAQETADAVTLQLQGKAKMTIERANIKSMTNLNMSLMPPGLETGLTLQQMADLLAFLLNPSAG